MPTYANLPDPFYHAEQAHRATREEEPVFDQVTVRGGTERFDGDAHGVAFSVYVRPNGEVKLYVKRSMRLKGGPHTMFGHDFANVALEPTE
jgi:hypothetical protein